VRSCDKNEGIICDQKEEDVSVVERGEVYEFNEEQLRKGYFRLLKSSQTAPVFFVGRKNSKK